MRRFPPAPLSARAVWARRLAYFGLAVMAAGLLLLRYRPVPVNAGFAVLAAGLLAVAAALAAAAWAFAEIWRTGARGASEAWRALILAVAMLAWPAAVAFGARGLPRINDISSDLADPPSFGRSRQAMLLRDNHVPGQPAD